jgi:uncharacterized protein (DUF1919 family)
MQVRAILDQKGLPRKLIQLSFIDNERVVGVEQEYGALTIRLQTDRSSLFILVDDYRRFIDNEMTAVLR